MAKETVFKKSVFGGFNRKQVIEYIAYLSSHCSDAATHEEFEVLRKQIDSLERLIEEKNALIEELKRQQSKQNVDPVIISLQEIIRNGRKLKQSNQEIENVTSSIQQIIDDKQPKIDSLLTRFASIRTEITSIQSGLKSVYSRLSEIDFESTDSDKTSAETLVHTEETTSKIMDATTAPVEEIRPENVTVTDYETDYTDDESEYIPLDLSFDDPEDEGKLINSIDNFFIELEKIADAQLFDLTTLLDSQDTDNE